MLPEESPSLTPHEPPQGHYSYRVYADPAMADGFDTLRFSGPIGTLLAEDQARVLSDFLGDVAGLTVLDVGTGTGRAALGAGPSGGHGDGRGRV